MRYVIRKLSALRDPRQPWKVKHDLLEILVICIIAVMCGARSSSQIMQYGLMREKWLKKYLPLKNGIAHRITIERVLCMVEPKQFQAIFNTIMQKLQTITAGMVVALDGKCFHSCKDENGKTHPLYMVSAWCDANNLVLAQVQASGKSNEITAIPQLLKFLKIPKCIVTIDAIGCQTEIVRQIKKDKEADYCIALKENQRSLHNEMVSYAEDCLSDLAQADKYTRVCTQEKGHGRIEKRTYTMFPDLSWYEDRDKWYGLSSLIRVDSKRTVGKLEPTYETRYYISSLTSIEDAARAIRTHWGIENRLHWTLDVVFREDSWATRKSTSAANLATIRKLSLAFLRKSTHPDDKQLTGPLKMWNCALNTEFLETVLFGKLTSLR